jgi:hypothetical protein
MTDKRNADVFEIASGAFFVCMTETENDQIVFSKVVKFETREKAEIAKKHFLGEYSGFDPIGDWED